MVDDDPRVRHLISQALAREGIEVDEAEDGRDGLLRAGARAYDVILLDLQMPGWDGLSVLRRLRSCRPEGAVIVVSGRCDPSTVGRCLAAGARSFLAKPFTLGELSEQVSAARPVRAEPLE